MPTDPKIAMMRAMRDQCMSGLRPNLPRIEAIANGDPFTHKGDQDLIQKVCCVIVADLYLACCGVDIGGSDAD